MLITNARMYTLERATGAAWRKLLAWVGDVAGVSMRYELHAAPAPLDALWRRPDLGCALMCGYPFAAWRDANVPRPALLAAAVPRNAEPEGRSRYRTALVVASRSAIARPEDLQGTRMAFTTPDSQSGYQAVREWAAVRAASAGGRWFGETIGPLVTPRRVVEAVLSGEADAGPLDGYWLELLRLHEPVTAAKLRVVALTEWTPLPPFVCSATLEPPVRTYLATALVMAGRTPDLAQERATLALAGIVPADAADYAILATRARDADNVGYPVLQ
jgi:ABC-type phosphate/phosphonate transport system substrate-binding protein